MSQMKFERERAENKEGGIEWKEQRMERGKKLKKNAEVL